MSVTLHPYFGDPSKFSYKEAGETYKVTTLGNQIVSVLEIDLASPKKLALSIKAFGSTPDKELINLHRIKAVYLGRITDLEHTPLTERDDAVENANIQIAVVESKVVISVVGHEEKQIDWKVNISQFEL